jgi:hypothetical protein
MSGSEGAGEGEDEPPEAVDDMVGATRWQKTARRKKLEAEAQAKMEEEEKPIVSEGGEQKGEESVVVESKPKEDKISPAERRRRIKEQIIAEGEGEGFKGYRRRVG